MAALLSRTEEPVRLLTADQLGVGGAAAIKEHSSNRPDDPPLEDDHPLYVSVRGLLENFGGVIFTGPPGTSKSYFAAKIATKLTDGDRQRVRYVQFHPSYQYEDFMQGFVPKPDGTGFDLVPKHFVLMCKWAAASDPDKLYVLVIDELSRGDPGRVFGEALTYVEKSKRNLPFTLASGVECSVPVNLVILATMNPLDRGVDEVDAAFERRFAKISMEPDRAILVERLEANGIEEPLRSNIVRFFSKVNGYAETNPQAAIGHTFFNDVTDLASLRSLWDHQLRFLVEKAYRLNPDTRDELKDEFRALLVPSQAPSDIADPPGAPVEDAPAEEEQPAPGDA